MILTDREWLRFVTFALFAGGVVGAAYTGALALRGHPPMWAIGAGVIAPGLIAVAVHLAIRYLLDRASTPTSDAESIEEPTDDTAEDTA